MLSYWKSITLLQIIVILNVLLLLPQASEEFDFGFGFGAEESNEKQDSSKLTHSTRQQEPAKRAKADKKFKFHKIERVYVDEYVTDDDEVRESDDVMSAASHQMNEDEEYQFERARKPVKDKESNTKQDNAKKLKKRNKRKDVGYHHDDDDEDDAQETHAPTKSWFKSLYDYLLNSDNVVNSAEKNDKSNSIITWLIWLGEKTGRLKPAPVLPKEKTPFWQSYLNRWPFNTFFPMDKTEKPLRMPRRSNNGQYATSSDSNENIAEPISEAHFQSLLHTLPGFVVNASHVSDIECRQQLQIFQRQLRAHKLWTLQMLDANGKLTSGILRGNINQLGDFDMCTQVKTMIKVTPDSPMRIRGKYCLAHIETDTDVDALKLAVHLAHGRGLWNSHVGNPGHFVPRYAVANWGVCIPHLCTADVVQEMIETNLKPYKVTGVDVNVEVNENDCVMRQNRNLTKIMKKDMHFTISAMVMVLLFMLVISTLIFEYWAQFTTTARKLKLKLRRQSTQTTESLSEADADKPSEAADETAADIVETITEDDGTNAEPTEAPNQQAMSFKTLLQELLKSFSPKRTLGELLSRDRLDMEFPVIHALKIIATLMLYICLKYLMIGHLPIKNRDTLVRAMDQPLSILFRAPFIYADLLLIIAGFLSAYQLSAEMEANMHIHLLKRMAAKIMRYLPTIYVVLMFQTWILPYLGTGPLWSTLVGENSRLCAEQMWRNFFSVQNAIDMEETCSASTIQLALEMQLYLLGPLVIWLYYTDADAGFFAYGAFHALSVAARYSRTSREHLSMILFHGMNVSKFYRTANMLYASPICRATPYLLGIGAGLLYRTQNGVIEITDALLPVGWLIAVVGIVWCFWSPADAMHTDFVYTNTDAASYAAWCPLILGLAIMWIIFQFPKAENSFFRFLLTTRPVLILSRIAFPMQMIMFLVVMKNTASVKETMNFHLSDLVDLQEIGMIIMLGTLVSFLIDVPAQQIRHLLVQRLFIERRVQSNTNDDNTDAAANDGVESDLPESPNDAQATTPEPTESVWASDAEEEENKYLTRRRSSVGIAVQQTTKSPGTESKSEDEEEEEEEIREVEEVKKRPVTPSPPPTPVVEEKKPIYTRRRRPTADD